MTRNEFAEMIKRKDVTEISPRDCRTYYDLFKDMDVMLKDKMLSVDTRIKLGKAMKLYWARALYQYENGKAPVEVFHGMYLGVDNRCSTRNKYRTMIPDTMPVAECKKLFKQFVEKIAEREPF